MALTYLFFMTKINLENDQKKERGIMEKEDFFETLKVVKRNGKKVDFDGAKIALAIKKGFDNIVIPDDIEVETGKNYTEKDMQKVYQSVM